MAVWLSQTANEWHKESQTIEIVHKQHRFAKNTPDDIWVPKLIEEDWVVLSADMSKRAYPKLHHVCRDHNIPLIEFAGALGQAGTFEWIRAILHLWPNMLGMAIDKKAERLRIHYAELIKGQVSRHFHTRKLDWPTGTTKPSAGQSQKRSKPKA